MADTVRDSHAVGVLSTFSSIDMSALHSHKNGVVGPPAQRPTEPRAARKIDLIDGWGGSSPPDTVDIGGRIITSQQVSNSTACSAASWFSAGWSASTSPLSGG
ncbi:hypothetical protein [Blastococcus goldschmidtiae]|uniref:Uncharacterized protein n=1 Tax=Blastococcus goldschmidtiae TaxID=3075546 RepID=A0ABU2KDH3_9ACTN|nr:hypothetical protein [Blastococcus sp. DSM 46792]MDT0278238.1 hypothetical protein [Blastococcus sp. DSM 46792]